MKIFEITKHLNRGGRARILALSLFILILSVFSCANDAVIDDFTNPVISDSAEKIIFSGSLRFDGAVPQALSKISNESEVTGRSAFPSQVTSETSDVKYYISARATGPEGISEEIKGSVDQTAKSYSIGLTIGRTYTLTASLKKTLTDGRQVTIMEDEWENVTPSRTNTSLTHDFILKPVEGGNGSIKLKMTLPTGIDCPSLSGDEIESTIQFHDDYTTATATISVDVIPAGIYNITINFYKSSGKFLLYSISQTINVFAGMETNTWQDDGSSNSPISAGKFVLTDEIIKNYQRTIFYVSEKDFTGKEIPVGQTRTGSPYAPFASLSDALNTIANNNKAEDYKIFIGGSLTGNTQISTLIKTENAKSLIIEGFTGNSSDCLVGDGSGSVLTVGSSVPLTIKNLKITGGNAEKGGGINMTAGSNVTLDAGALIGEDKTSLPDSSSYGNKATKGGGGIYNTQGALVLKKGSKVCYNYEGSSSYNGGEGGGGIKLFGGSLTIYDGAVVSYNKTTTRGGGVDIDKGSSNASFVMTGGEIIHNDSTGWGGGVMMRTVNCSFDFKSGKISYNAVSGTSSGWAPNGGGIFMDGGIFTMSGDAEISYNTANLYNGGIRFVGESCEVHLNGGVIKNNKALGGGAGAVSMGGNPIAFTMSGSISIPFDVEGDSEHKNDIELADGKVIKITGPLSRKDTNPIATIMPQSYSRGRTLVEADGINVTDLTPYKDFFAVKNTDWLVNLSADKKKLVLDSPIYVAGSNHQVCTADGSYSGTGEKSAPYASIEQAIYAINDLNNNNAQYTILIDGEINSSQIIPADVKAAYITLKGASGNTFDKINATGVSAPALTIALESASKAVDIQNLTITGGNAVNGGGILIGDSAVVFLGNDLIITGNTAAGLGGGVYAPNGVNVSGNVEIKGNTDSASTPNPSNLYLLSGKKVNVTGALTKGSERAKIGISTEDAPSLTSKVTFTIDYGKHNSAIAPGTYFTGDKWTVTPGSGTPYEAVLAASGGNITIEPIYEDITIKADKTTFIKSASSKVMTFTITGTGSSEVSIKNYAVSYHGDTVPASFYETGTNTLKLLDSLPAGDYIVSVTAEDSKGREYSASFSVEIKDIKTYTADEALTAISAMTTSGTITVTGGIDDNQVQEISSAINQLDSNILVKLDLSMTTGLSGQCSSFSGNDNIAEIILPDGITELPTERFRDCSNLSNIYIPASVSTINGWAFIYSPTGVTVADDSPYFKNVGKALYSKDGKKLVLYCDKLTEDSTFTVPAEVEEIGDFAFGNAKIKSINFESNTNLKTVGEHAFDRARNLISISFPDSVETIGDSCFQYTPSLSSIKLPASLKKVPSGFCNYSAAFTNIVIPDGVTEIEYAAFWGLDQLESVTLPASVTKITNGAFNYCKRPFTVNYKGTEAQKSLIVIDESDNEAIIGATWNCNYTGN